MHQTAAFPAEETDPAPADLRAEVQASLALNRAVLQALAALSPTMAAVIASALDDELQFVRHSGASLQALELIEDVRDRLADQAADSDKMSGLELALVAAADALPELRVRREA